ncbi:MAG: OadG family protein [Muribaculaceae bacterium]|nr:OadG family protein [Muribaculaceae bacterium]
MKKIILLVLAVACSIASLDAQDRKALRINEVMVVGDSSIVDDYGNHGAWIELYNSNFGPLEIAKIFITDDPNNPTKYPVPIGDVNTKIPRRQHVIFWADGQPDKGTFHTNFTLKPGQPNYIAIYDADGKTLIDEVTVPADLKPNTSYAREVDGVGTWQVRDGSQRDLSYITPSSSNVIVATNSKVDFFREHDENGLGLTIIAMGIVFAALLLLSLCFYIISKIGAYLLHRKESATTPGAVKIDEKGKKIVSSGEEIAAVVMALHEHFNSHDAESAVLTLNKVKKAYSPWNSKIYNMRRLPRG